MYNWVTLLYSRKTVNQLYSNKSEKKKKTPNRRKPQPLSKPRPKQWLWRQESSFEKHPWTHTQTWISLTLRQPKTLWLRRQPKYPRKSTPRRNKLDRSAIIKFPLMTESTMKKTEDPTTLLFTVAVQASKHQLKHVMKKLCDADMAKVITLIRPNGEEAYVRLWCFGMLPTKLATEFTWLVLNIKVLTRQKEGKSQQQQQQIPL